MNRRVILCWSVVLAIALLILAAGAVSFAQEPSPQADGTSHWLHFGYDTAHTGYNPLESTISLTTVSQLRRLWGIGCADSRSWHTEYHQSPAIYSNTLLTTASFDSRMHRLSAYNVHTRARLWEASEENPHAPQPVVSRDGVLFTLTGYSPTYLWALDALTGLPRWRFFSGLQMGIEMLNQVTVDEDLGRIYFLENDTQTYWWGAGALWAADKEDGSVAWMMDKAHGFYNFKGRYVLLQSGKIYVIARVPQASYPYDEKDRMVRVDTTSRDFEVVYDRPPNTQDIRNNVICGGMLVVGYQYPAYPTAVIAGYNVLSSTIVWTKTTETPTGEFACNTDKHTVYVPTNPFLYAFDATSGGQIWKYAGYGAIHTPSIANGIIYFTSRTDLIGIDEESHQQVYSYALGATSGEMAQIAIANGTLAFSHGGWDTLESDCSLYVLGLPDYDTYVPALVRSD